MSDPTAKGAPRAPHKRRPQARSAQTPPFLSPWAREPRLRLRASWLVVPALALVCVVTITADLAGRATAAYQRSLERAATVAADPIPEVSETTASEQRARERAAYLEEWGGRIDTYLAGSPLEGHGATFARAAWDYGVDARLSPAIAMVESNKGRNCAHAHNAWGWGSKSWGSWDEAIDAHVHGLADNYGPALSRRMARKYNEETPNAWYALVLGEMERI